MDILVIFISLALLMFFAYRGFSVILFAPIFAVLAAAISGFSIMPAYTDVFLPHAANYFKAFFPVFMLGAVFGKVMEDSGLAKSIAHAILQGLGKERGVLAVALACLVLTYGGVSLFVVVFAVYPFACALFKEAGIPKRLIPGCIALGAFTITMTCIPGTPQIQSVIPGNFYGTDTWAAPWTGMFVAILTFALGLTWLEYRRKSAAKAGEGYGNHTINEPQIDENALKNLPHWALAMIPLLLVLVVNFILSHYYVWDKNLLDPIKTLKPPLIAASVASAKGVWNLIIALIVGIAAAIAIGFKTMKVSGGGIAKSLNAGVIGSLLAILNTASEVGYGNLIASLPGFRSIADWLLAIKVGGTPLVSEAVTVNVLAGITGSASGGMSIALGIMGKEWLAWAQQVGLSPEVLHRIASIASGGLDTLPHNGAVITLLAVCGLTHKQSYLDIFMVATLITVAMGFVGILFHSITGLV